MTFQTVNRVVSPVYTFNVFQPKIDQYSEIVAAMVQVTYDIMDYAQNHKDEIAPYMSQLVGLEENVLKQHNIVYTPPLPMHSS